MNPLELVEALLLAGEVDAAVAALDDHLTAQPADAAARQLRRAIWQRMGDAHRAAALAELEQLTAPTVDDYVQRAILREAGGDLAGAIRAIRAAEGLRPFDAALLERRVRLLLRAGRTAEAIGLLNMLILGWIPNGWRWLRWRGQAYQQRGDLACAVSDFSAALAELTALADPPALIVNAQAQTYVQRAAGYRALGIWAAAAADLRSAAALLPTDATIAFALALVTYAADPAAPDALTAACAVCAPIRARATGSIRTELDGLLEEDPAYAPLRTALIISG